MSQSRRQKKKQVNASSSPSGSSSTPSTISTTPVLGAATLATPAVPTEAALPTPMPTAGKGLAGSRFATPADTTEPGALLTAAASATIDPPNVQTPLPENKGAEKVVEQVEKLQPEKEKEKDGTGAEVEAPPSGRKKTRRQRGAQARANKRNAFAAEHPEEEGHSRAEDDTVNDKLSVAGDESLVGDDTAEDVTHAAAGIAAQTPTASGESSTAEEKTGGPRRGPGQRPPHPNGEWTEEHKQWYRDQISFLQAALKDNKKITKDRIKNLEDKLQETHASNKRKMNLVIRERDEAKEKGYQDAEKEFKAKLSDLAEAGDAGLFKQLEQEYEERLQKLLAENDEEKDEMIADCLTEQEEAYSKRLEAVKNEHEAKFNELKERKDAVINAVKQNLDQRGRDLDQRSATLADAELAYQEKAKAHNDLLDQKDKILTLTAQLKESEKKVTEISKNSSLLMDDGTMLTSYEVQEIKTKYAHCLRDNEDLSLKVQQLEADARRRDAEISSSDAKTEQYTTQIRNLEKDVKKAGEDVGKMQRRSEKVAKMYNDRKEEFDRASRDSQNAKAELAQLRKDIADSAATSTASNLTIAAQSGRIRELAKRVKELEVVKANYDEYISRRSGEQSEAPGFSGGIERYKGDQPAPNEFSAEEHKDLVENYQSIVDDLEAYYEQESQSEGGSEKESELAEARVKIFELEKEIQELRAQATSGINLEAELYDSGEENTEVASAREKIIELEAVIAELQNELRGKVSSEDTNATLVQVRDTIDGLGAEIEDLEDRDQRNSDSEANVEQSADLVRAEVEMRAEIGEFENNRKDNAVEHAAKLNEVRAEYQAEILVLKTENYELRDTLETVQESLGEAQQSVDDLNLTLATRYSTIQSLQDQIESDPYHKIRGLETKIEKMKYDHAHDRTKTDPLNNMIDGLESEKAELLEQVENLKTEIKKSEKAITPIPVRVGGSIFDPQTPRQTSAESEVSSERRIDELSDRLLRLTTDNSTLEAARDTARRESSGYAEELKELRRKLDDDHMKSRTTISSNNAKIRELEEKLAKAKAKKPEVATEGPTGVDTSATIVLPAVIPNMTFAIKHNPFIQFFRIYIHAMIIFLTGLNMIIGVLPRPFNRMTLQPPAYVSQELDIAKDRLQDPESMTAPLIETTATVILVESPSHFLNILMFLCQISLVGFVFYAYFSLLHERNLWLHDNKFAQSTISNLYATGVAARSFFGQREVILALLTWLFGRSLFRSHPSWRARILKSLAWAVPFLGLLTETVIEYRTVEKVGYYLYIHYDAGWLAATLAG